MARLLRHVIPLVVTGLVSGALVASSASAAPTWQPVTSLFADLSVAGGSAQTPVVEVDPGGNATALWSRYDGTQLVVQAATRPAGGTWSAPVDLAAGRSIFEPRLALDAAGNATAVWRRSDVASSVVQAATRPAGGTWSTPVDLSVDPSVDLMEFSERPQVAVDAAGVATATWSRYDGSKYVVQAATRAPGGTWSTAVDLSAPGQSARTPQIAVDPAGNATVLWNLGASRFNGGRLQAATRPVDGTWSAPVDVSAAGGSASNPQLVVDATGAVTAVWSRFNGSYGIQTASRPLGGTWTVPLDLSAPGENFTTPQLAANPQGSTTATWQRHDGSGWIVTAATRAPGAGWTAPVDLSNPGHDGWDPQVAVDPAGNTTAIWALADAGDSNKNSTIQAARRPVGGTWTAPVDLSAAGGNAFHPQVAVDPAGNATTTWSRHDGTSWIVQARGLDAAGPVVTALTGPGTSGSGRVPAYSVKAHDVWSEVASAQWVFADGTTATGTSVTRANAGDGTGPVKVTLTDAVGNATVCTYTATYSCRATSRVAPVITRASLARHRIRVHGSESSAPRKTKATVFLTAAAKVTLVFKRSGSKKAIRLTDRRQAGRNAFTIRARLGRNKVLLPGRWTISVTATNKAGTSQREKLRLRVVR